jgi:N-methylhydantoinase B
MTQTVKKEDNLIRDLDEAEFTARYGCDRFTAFVLTSRLSYAGNHMCTGLLREAFSPIIQLAHDFACTISGPPEDGYPMAVVSESLPVFLGTMTDAVRNMVTEYGVSRLRPGDVLLCNDPYRVGTHVNDFCFVRPVFVDGRPISFLSLRAHQLDIGGTVPGGFSGTKANVYENGLVIPPQLIYSADEPVRSTFSLIFDNSRFGELLLPDFHSIHRQLQFGERLVQENIERYGLTAYLGTLRYRCDTSAERMRAAIARIPDGDYVGTDTVDADGVDESEEYHVQVTIRKRGNSIEADLSGTSRQARTCINASAFDAKTVIGVALTMLLDPQAPFTSGTWRDIDVVAPPGSMLNALPPDGAIMMYWEVTGPLIAAVLSALNPVLGEDGIGGDYCSENTHNAFGVTPDGVPWASIAECGGERGPWGASKRGDADSYSITYQLNVRDAPTESIEHHSPVVLLRKEAAIDTGGAGYHRGGAAAMRDALWLQAAQHHSAPFHTKTPSGVGAHGGGAGACGAVWIFPPRDGVPVGVPGTDASAYAGAVPIAGVVDPETNMLRPDGGTYQYFAREPVWRTAPGSVTRNLTNGGGGWGDPWQRDPDRVRRDVRDGYVSVEAARRDYGVVVTGDSEGDPENVAVDVGATRALRENRSKS